MQMKIEEIAELKDYERDYLKILRKKEIRKDHWTDDMELRYLNEVL